MQLQSLVRKAVEDLHHPLVEVLLVVVEGDWLMPWELLLLPERARSAILVSLLESSMYV